MKPTSPQIDSIVEKHLESLNSMPARDEQAAAQGRAAFLTQAENYAQAVSKQPKQRLIHWNINPKHLFQRKERFSMFSTLVTLFAVLALTFGGATATVFAAQDSLPGEALYQLKIQSEDYRLNWENNEMEKVGLALEFANRRLEEVQAMHKLGQSIPESVPLRLQNQLDAALRFASGLDEDELPPALDKIRQTIEQQERIMDQLQDGTHEDPILLQVRDQLRTRLSWVEAGETDPATFRARYGAFGKDNLPPAETGEPGESFGPGPFVTGTPTPGSSYGPGPGLQATCTCTPQAEDGYGPGPQPTEAPGFGPGPQPTEAPGNGVGPGPLPTEKPGDGTGTGPKPTDPGNDNGSGSDSGNKP